MMPNQQGALAEAANQMPDEEGAEPVPDNEGAEMPADDGSAPDAGSPDGGGEKAYSKEDRELFDLVVGRTMAALTQHADDLDKAMRADPVRATVEFGTSAIRTVAMGAGDAGKPISFEILVQAGMQVIKELAGIANDKGYLQDDEIETFLKETFQQSLSKYTSMDAKDGTLKKEDIEKAQQAAGPMDKAKVAGAAADQVQGRAQGALAQAQEM